MAQVLAASGDDCLIIDMEHGAVDLPSVHAMVAATQGTGATPIVRIPGTEHRLAKPVLDEARDILVVGTPALSKSAKS